MTLILLSVSLCLITAGVACIYWPAALVAAGVLLGASVWLLESAGE